MKTRNVAIYLFEQAEVLDFAGPFEVFNAANEVAGQGFFNVYTVAGQPELLKARYGFAVRPDYHTGNCPPPDILLIPGGEGRKIQMHNEQLLDWIRAQFDRLERLLSVCTGAFILARTGLLDGRRATTHHLTYSEFEQSFPAVSLVRQVKFADEGKIISSAGISAGINMALYVVDSLLGNQMGEKTAQYMEYDYQLRV